MSEKKKAREPAPENMEETEIPETCPETEPEDAAAPEEKAGQEEELNAKYLRLMADFQNYKRRCEKEKGDIYAYANEKLMAELLPVIDNFERALSHGSEIGESFTNGMQMIFKQMNDVLAKAGMKEIAALGEAFDPNVHNAVMTEDTDKYESGTVSEVMQKGYMLNQKVIRPSMVKVAQ